MCPTRVLVQVDQPVYRFPPLSTARHWVREVTNAITIVLHRLVPTRTDKLPGSPFPVHQTRKFSSTAAVHNMHSSNHLSCADHVTATRTHALTTTRNEAVLKPRPFKIHVYLPIPVPSTCRGIRGCGTWSSTLHSLFVNYRIYFV